MEVSLSSQALSLGCFSLLGLALGLFYDLLRPARYSGAGAFIWDGLFCFAAALGLFTLGMESGRPGLWDMGATLLFFCLYINHISSFVLPPILGILKYLHIFRSKLWLFAKKLQKTVKKIFTNPSD